MNAGCPEFRRLNYVARRDFLRIGAAGLFGLTMSDLFRARSQAADRLPVKAERVMVMWMNGGPPHQDMFDMKPDAPAEIRGPFNPIQTTVPELQVCELMPRLAKLAHKYTVLRSCSIGNETFEHSGGTYWLTGNPRRTRGTPQYPMYGNVVSKLRPATNGMPSYVSTGDVISYLKESYLGSTYDPIQFRPDNPEDQVRDMLVPPAELNLSALESRGDLLKQLDTTLREQEVLDPLVSGLDKFQQSSFDLLRSPKLREALDLDREDPKSFERYGTDYEGKKVLAGRRLLEAGVPFVFTDLLGGWDFHGQNFKGCIEKLPRVDNILASLVEDLDDRGMLESTLLVALGEMGRTPKINSNAGRDHWGTTQFVWLSGGGTKAGAVVGATDAQAAYVTDKYYSVESFGSTLYHLLGIDPGRTMMTTEDRPLRLIDKESPLIKEALA